MARPESPKARIIIDATLPRVEDTVTEVAIVDDEFYVDGQPTYKDIVFDGAKIQGLLLNSRMINAIFDDANPETRTRWRYPDTGVWDPQRNVDEFIRAMPSWREAGLLAVTVGIQGGSPEGYSKKQPWINAGYTMDGAVLPEYRARLAKVLDAANRSGLVVILSLFYFGQDQHLRDEAAVIHALENICGWVLDQKYRNVLIEVANECNVPRYDHAILRADRVHELVSRAKIASADGRRLLVGVSFGGGSIPTERVVRESDMILMHGNGVGDPDRITRMVETVRTMKEYQGVPILFNEDDHFAFDQDQNNMMAAVRAYASWGYFDPGERNYHDGYQSVPINWDASTERKRSFLSKVREITRSSAP